MTDSSFAAVWLWAPLAVPALVGVVAALVHRDRRWAAYPSLAAALAILLSGVALILQVRAHGPVQAADGLLRADALSAYVLAVVGLIASICVAGGLPQRGDLGDRSREDGTFWALLCAFLAAMSLATLADNLGVLWVGIEATTIATAFLVGHRGGRAALEAAWKYVVLGSVGVAVAFLGIVLIYAASLAGGSPTLSWAALVGGHPLDPTLARMGVGLAVLGFATKAGLAPLHSWLPDAHSQAPSPVSGLMSGVLLSVAFTAILRAQGIADVALGSGLVRGMLVVGGLGSLAVAALLTLTQRDYKRLLAYSSIEHMGILALGAAAGGPLGLAAVLLHIAGHGLAKSAMFIVAGRVLHWTGTHRVAAVRGMLVRRPDLGGPFLVGTAALLGFPPFVTFVTEVGIMVALWRSGLAWVACLALALLLVAFAGIGRQVLAMTVGVDTGPADLEEPPETADDETAPEQARASGAHATMGGDSPSRMADAPVAVALILAAALTLGALPLRSVLLDAAAALPSGRAAQHVTVEGADR